MKGIYDRSFGGYSYEIVDEEAYERYWWGKRPSTRELFEAWLKDPEKTQNSVALEHGKWPTTMRRHIWSLGRQGIIRRFKRDDLS
jgi:hypothetical protein